MTNEGEVLFALYGVDFDPAEATRLIGIAPTSVRVKQTGDGKEYSWKLSSGKVVGELIDVYEMSSVLVAKLIPKIEAIARFRERFDLHAELEVVLWISQDQRASTPTIGFALDVIEFLHAVGASIDVDTYRNV